MYIIRYKHRETLKINVNFIYSRNSKYDMNCANTALF